VYAAIDAVGLIRFTGHDPKGGYDLQDYKRHFEEERGSRHSALDQVTTAAFERLAMFAAQLTMSENLRRRLLPTSSITAIAMALVCASQLLSAQTMAVSIPSLRTNGQERVVGFEIHITSGRIAELPNAPIGWVISVDNDPSWNTVLKGSMVVGAAAVGRDFFREFLVIEKHESLGLPFDVQGEIVVTDAFANERRIRIGIKDLAMKRRH
jgi:hypothetical protein